MTLHQPHSPTAPWRTYRILRGEQGVFHYEPYKSTLLPLWRFKTPLIARQSSTALFNKFLEYEEQDDFVGMDMCRKFLQMGMTRSAREVWERVKGREGYVRAKGEFLEKQKKWDAEVKMESERKKKMDGDEGDEVALGDESKDMDGERGERGQEERGRKSKSKSTKRNADEGGNDKVKELVRGGKEDGDDCNDERRQEEGKGRSKRRKTK
ncbi:MAG: hypothetical protein OHK93_002693 [Ramalina farinacea]|uniref:Uncharacterized protein n=1 Tax=Ramalina farinacea TaxID=258253 RepID=A0AA43QTN4_9LECA|nr:hypothetical protein [Ramalina farinacea]